MHVSLCYDIKGSPHRDRFVTFEGGLVCHVADGIKVPKRTLTLLTEPSNEGKKK